MFKKLMRTSKEKVSSQNSDHLPTILLMGTGDSGKTTLFQQFNNFSIDSQNLLIKYLLNIYQNIVDTILKIAKYMTKHEIEYEKPENKV
jgi:GTPase SAR1 family protein